MPRTTTAELECLLSRLEAGTLDKSVWGYFWDPYGKKWFYELIAEKCRTIQSRSWGRDADLVSFAELMERCARDSVVRKQAVSEILRLWTRLGPRMQTFAQSLDAYTAQHGLVYTDKETPAKNHFTLDHCAKYVLNEMGRFVADHSTHAAAATPPRGFLHDAAYFFNSQPF